MQVFVAGDGVQYARPATASTVQGVGTGSFGEHWEAIVAGRRPDLPVRRCRATPAASNRTPIAEGAEMAPPTKLVELAAMGGLDADVLVARRPVRDDPDVDARQPTQQSVGERLGEAPGAPAG